MHTRRTRIDGNLFGCFLHHCSYGLTGVGVAARMRPVRFYEERTPKSQVYDVSIVKQRIERTHSTVYSRNFEGSKPLASRHAGEIQNGCGLFEK
ncbi:hypothetical protein A3D88_01795 [Candidatus Peribacteria bacterium RIFCSPHIGHO2_02_FULL_52_16]|nr:MAG: hypothetical protein A2706_04990 [Candidatus Peribacteria bacterium RIFCSPHIGHO2_01_FULL_51_35]OGJ61121.1 MAG: hypothetical protein A3D88_01795 [Candidatus Peribacteria bacterium RIFCSPHIGHO2_02_FULL_52_16]